MVLASGTLNPRRQGEVGTRHKSSCSPRIGDFMESKGVGASDLAIGAPRVNSGLEESTCRADPAVYTLLGAQLAGGFESGSASYWSALLAWKASRLGGPACVDSRNHRLVSS